MTEPHKSKVWHREVIAPEVETVLEELHQRTFLADFYLAGGTGLALQLGHRRSVDLDFFTQRPFDQERFLARLAARHAGGDLLGGCERLLQKGSTCAFVARVYATPR